MVQYEDEEDDRQQQDRDEDNFREDMGDEAFESRFITNPIIKKMQKSDATIKELEKLNLELKDKEKDLRRFLDAINSYAEELKSRYIDKDDSCQ